eukprot:NODE_22196_length_247_cov_1.282828_g21027_i0.p3 GENE.NODE_22196_length_247_cov_1.282828_g21027_i0~~NODE_22196_length_247_cov_1.282828_g21027_i0.p3  ORF type:complete len:53 (-),score=13.65 NODE_22196_length_247_cov_1.282828_g21027_i0:88-246(-)
MDRTKFLLWRSGGVALVVMQFDQFFRFTVLIVHALKLFRRCFFVQAAVVATA